MIGTGGCGRIGAWKWKPRTQSRALSDVGGRVGGGGWGGERGGVEGALLLRVVGGKGRAGAAGKTCGIPASSVAVGRNPSSCCPLKAAHGAAGAGRRSGLTCRPAHRGGCCSPSRTLRLMGRGVAGGLNLHVRAAVGALLLPTRTAVDTHPAGLLAAAGYWLLATGGSAQATHAAGHPRCCRTCTWRCRGACDAAHRNACSGKQQCAAIGGGGGGRATGAPAGTPHRRARKPAAAPARRAAGLCGDPSALLRGGNQNHPSSLAALETACLALRATGYEVGSFSSPPPSHVKPEGLPGEKMSVNLALELMTSCRRHPMGHFGSSAWLFA